MRKWDIMDSEEPKMFYWDYTMFLILPALALALYAQAKVRGAYAKYGRIFASSRITGAEAAHRILQTGGAGEVAIEKIAGQLTDHYDPRKKVLRLSEGVYDNTSIAALGHRRPRGGPRPSARDGFRAARRPERHLSRGEHRLDPRLPPLLHRLSHELPRAERPDGHRHPALRRGRRLLGHHTCPSSSTRPRGPWPCSASAVFSSGTRSTGPARSSPPPP